MPSFAASPKRVSACALLSFAALAFSVPAQVAHKPALPPQPARKPAVPTEGNMQRVDHGRFQQVPVYLPQGEVQRAVIWFADPKLDALHSDNGWRQRDVQALVDDGALVALVDMKGLHAQLAKEGGECGFGAGDVENFSRYLQAFEHMDSYHLPVVVGDGEGSAWAYAVAASAPPQVLAGAVTDGICANVGVPKQVCGAGVSPRSDSVQATGKLQTPWLIGEADAAHANANACAAAPLPALLRQMPAARQFKRDDHGDWLPGLRAAVKELSAQKGNSVPPPPKDLAGLPVIEVAARGAASGAEAHTFAVFVSGDGGWAGLDKNVAGALAAQGIPVVGVDSLRYFWSKRTPQGFANDLDRIIRFYAAHWQRSRVLVIGFSQGADVLPAALNRLPPATKQLIDLNALLSLGKTAAYEFHVGNWFGSVSDGLPIRPEVLKLPPRKTLCVYGEKDGDSICPDLPANTIPTARLPGDHHFGGKFDDVAKLIRAHLDAAQTGAAADP